ncbi:uncharacterized protein [Rutidosis leptorrhynchoides]|uniref:uncharacterized protein isoform X2 n=1 Tax=Rutidosis leptorrhynchoides TaxID=125765 RepID=UPI003A99A7A9
MPIIKVFRRFRSSNISPKQAITELSNLVPGSNAELSERSSAGPLASKGPIRKKVASADRRVMLESFVNKYRAMNLGKFPSTTNAQKAVGGSYYIIRKMLQEMEYNVKIFSEEKVLVKEDKKLTKGNDTTEMAVELSKSQEESNNQVTISQQICEDPLLESKREDTINRDIVIESSGSQDESNDQVTVSQQLCGDHMLESKGEDTLHRETVIESSGSQDESNNQVTVSQLLCEDHMLESKGEDTLHLETVIESSGSQDESNNQATVSQLLCEDHMLESKGEDTLHRETVIESSGSQDESNSQVSTNQQLSENHSLDSVSNLDREFELKEGLQVSTSNADTGNSDSTKCHQMPEQQPNDEPRSEDKFDFEDSHSKVEKQDDGITNIMRDMPEQQKDKKLSEEPSLWGSLKSMASEFFNMWKK